MQEKFLIPFNRPALLGCELTYMSEAVERSHASAGGHFTERCVELLSAELGAADVVLTTSCTDALEMSAMLLDIGPGDVVVVPSFTFVSTALAFVRAGATVRFADIEPDTLGIDPASVETELDERVRVVVPVHYAGVGCDMAGLEQVVPAGVDIVEDNAHGLFGMLDGRALGSFGRASTLSFHETKNFSCGEGGALVLRDERDVERAHILLDKGTNRRSFTAGQVDKYTWVGTGSSFGLSDVLAAYLLAQLEQRSDVLRRRQQIWRRYDERLRDVAIEHGGRSMSIPADRTCSWHMFYVLTRTATLRDELISHLAEHGVNATFHYVPLHSSPAGLRATDRPPICPVSTDVSARLVRLPFHTSLTVDEQDRVCTLVADWLRTS